LNRTLPLVDRHFGGRIPAPGAPEGPDGTLRTAAAAVPDAADARIGTFDFTRGLAEIWRFLGVANKYVDEAAPWAALKEGNPARAGAIVYNTLEALRIATILLVPVLPTAAQRVWGQLGIAAPLSAQRLADARGWGGLPAGTRIHLGAPLFPRIETRPASAPTADGDRANSSHRGGGGMSEITIDDFNKIDLRVAEVLEAKRVAGADKLLELRIKIGEATRTLVAGIAEQYAPESLIGRKIVVVANLQPRRLRGVESQGMLLAANDGARAVLLAPDSDVPSGVRVS
ncbi:MAG TPA: methionine--tRNA ligase subunit beta, partial [bacterium]|nr:methionine--tRNA ligase subunit beta [bacterium]